MPKKQQHDKWDVLNEIMTIDSPWLKLIVERLTNENNQEIDYWRVQKPDGLLIIVIQNNKILLPKPMYRPGIKKYTLDLCGGRRSQKNSNLTEDAKKIIIRELGINNYKLDIQINLLNNIGFNLDSSFSNVKLFIFIAQLSSDTKINNLYSKKSYYANKQGITKLLNDMDCAQCKLALHEWEHFLNKNLT